MYKCIWSKSHCGNTGITHLTIFTEIWCSHGCTTDGLVDAHEQDIQMDTKADRLVRNLDEVHYGCPADGLADAHTWCYLLCYCLLWMLRRQTC